MTVDLTGRNFLIVGINYAPETTGIAPYTTAMARSLVAAGGDVTVITGIPHYPQWKVQDPRLLDEPYSLEHLDGVRVLRVRHHVPRTPDLAGRARMEWSFFRGASRAIRSATTEFDAVIAVTPSLSGAAAATFTTGKTPRAVVVQDLTGVGAKESGSAGAGVAQVIGGIEQRLLNRFDLVGVIAPRMGELLADGGVDPERIVSVPNFTHIVAPTTTRGEAREKLGWDTDTFTIVHTGNMGMKQGLENVVEAAEEAHRRGLKAHFVLVGDGNQRERLAELAASVPSSHLTLVPPLPDDLYPLALAASDVLLLNERAGVREMCLPSKLTSYVAASRPILAAVEADGISGATLRGAEAAQICPPGNPMALVDSLQMLSRDAQLQDRLTANARRFGQERYSAGAAARRYQRLAAQLLDVATAGRR